MRLIHSLQHLALFPPQTCSAFFTVLPFRFWGRGIECGRGLRTISSFKNLELIKLFSTSIKQKFLGPGKAQD